MNKRDFYKIRYIRFIVPGEFLQENFLLSYIYKDGINNAKNIISLYWFITFWKRKDYVLVELNIDMIIFLFIFQKVLN